MEQVVSILVAEIFKLDQHIWPSISDSPQQFIDEGVVSITVKNKNGVELSYLPCESRFFDTQIKWIVD